MKKIVCYYNGPNFWKNKEAAVEELYAFVVLIKKMFEQCGCSVVLCDVSDSEDRKKIFQLFQNHDVYFTIGIGAAGLDLYMDNGKGLYEEYLVPHVFCIADQPALGYKDKFFMGRFINARCNHLIIQVPDETCVEALKLAKPKSEIKKWYIPAYVVRTDCDAFSYKREIDVLHTGRLYTNQIPVRVWNDNTYRFSLNVRSVLNDVADYLEQWAVNVYDGFNFVIKERKIETPLERFFPYFSEVTWYIMSWRRQKLVDALVKEDIPLTMADSSWRDYRHANKMRILGTNYNETRELYKKAKILVSDVALFNHSIHKRNLDAMAAGATVVSEYTTFMDKEFSKENAVELFQWHAVNTVPSVVKKLLNNDKKRETMARNAFDIVSTYTEERYVGKILNIVDSYLHENTKVNNE